jgi:hypothetical protein
MQDKVCAVVVTYNPAPDKLSRSLRDCDHRSMILLSITAPRSRYTAATRSFVHLLDNEITRVQVGQVNVH